MKYKHCPVCDEGYLIDMYDEEDGLEYSCCNSCGSEVADADQLRRNKESKKKTDSYTQEDHYNMNISTKASLFAAVCLALLAGCTMEGGEIAPEDLNKVMVCKDTRDGEVFKFNTSTAENIRAGIGAPSSMDITTLDGREMTLTSTMESWLKCQEQ